MCIRDSNKDFWIIDEEAAEVVRLIFRLFIGDVYKRQEYIKTRTKKRPKIAVVLGSGLGKLTADFTDTEELSYKDIPNFPVSLNSIW